MTEDLEESIPQLVIKNFKHTEISKGQLSFLVVAERAEIFDERKQTKLYGMTFFEYDAAGKIVTNGKADEATFEIESEDALLTGNIEIYSKKQEAYITSNSFTWRKATKMLTGETNDTVFLSKEDGSTVEGEGFEANFKYNTITFSSNVTGSYVTKEDGEDEE